MGFSFLAKYNLFPIDKASFNPYILGGIAFQFFIFPEVQFFIYDQFGNIIATGGHPSDGFQAFSIPLGGGLDIFLSKNFAFSGSARYIIQNWSNELISDGGTVESGMDGNAIMILIGGIFHL